MASWRNVSRSTTAVNGPEAVGGEVGVEAGVALVAAAAAAAVAVAVVAVAAVAVAAGEEVEADNARGRVGVDGGGNEDTGVCVV